jgi:hypothetical protein
MKVSYRNLNSFRLVSVSRRCSSSCTVCTATLNITLNRIYRLTASFYIVRVNYVSQCTDENFSIGAIPLKMSQVDIEKRSEVPFANSWHADFCPIRPSLCRQTHRSMDWNVVCTQNAMHLGRRAGVTKRRRWRSAEWKLIVQCTTSMFVLR